MMGKPLLHKEYAIQVGQRGDNAVTKAKTQLKVRSAEACYRSTKPAAAALLASTYDLKLPGVTVGGVDRRKRPPPEGREERELKARLVIAEATFDGAVARHKRLMLPELREWGNPELKLQRLLRAEEALDQVEVAKAAVLGIWEEREAAANEAVARARLREEAAKERADPWRRGQI